MLGEELVREYEQDHDVFENTGPTSWLESVGGPDQLSFAGDRSVV